MINTTVNRPAPLLQAALNMSFGDIQWAIGYPDGSYAIGISGWVSGFKSEIYGRAIARVRSEIMSDMGFEVIECGFMKPRGVDKAGAVVVFRIAEKGVVVL